MLTQQLATRHPRGSGVPHYLEAIRTLRPFISTERQAKIDEVLAWRSGSVRVVIEDPINPSNAWACLRTMDRFAARASARAVLFYGSSQLAAEAVVTPPFGRSAAQLRRAVR